MTILRNIFSKEFKRFFCSRKLVVFILFILILSIVVGLDCGNYKNKVLKAKEFQKIEEETFKVIPNYSVYRVIGFRILSIPGASSIFFNSSGLLSEFTSTITGLIRLSIFSTLKGELLFQNKDPIPFDFSGILFLFASLYSILFLGFTALRNTEYQKMLCSIAPKSWIYFSTLLSRFIILAIKLVLIFASTFVIAIICNVSFSSGDLIGLLVHFSTTFALLVFFLVVGAFLGQLIKSTWKSITVIIGLWALLVFVIPGALNSTVNKSAKNITSQYKTELEKLKVTFEFEKRAVEEAGKFDRGNIEIARKIIEGFWNDDYKKIIALEERQKKEIERVVEKYYLLSLFTPTTLYTLTANEVSSQGYGSFLDFYKYVKDLQVKFVRFIIDRTYYDDPKVMVNFIKGDENLFQAKSRFPKNFLAGLLITFGWIIVILSLSYRFYVKSLCKLTGKEIDSISGNFDVKFKKGEFQVWHTSSEMLKNLLYNLFSGRLQELKSKNHSIKVLLDEKDIIAERNTEKFAYFGNVKHIPEDIKAKDLILFYGRIMGASKDLINNTLESKQIKSIKNKRFAKLDGSQKADVILSLTYLTKVSVYLIYEIETILSIDYAKRLKDRMETLSSEGALVLYLTPNDQNINKEKKNIIKKTKNWTGLIDAYKTIEDK